MRRGITQRSLAPTNPTTSNNLKQDRSHNNSTIQHPTNLITKQKMDRLQEVVVIQLQTPRIVTQHPRRNKDPNRQDS